MSAFGRFGRGRRYTVEEEGCVGRWDGRSWELLLDLAPQIHLYDIAGTFEEDLWVVGSNGFVVVVHWP